ncbi:MAG TPA: ElyC/SanA/YdcF family protein [Rhizomicrobium sp.]|jgi:hypothetical protein
MYFKRDIGPHWAMVPVAIHEYRWRPFFQIGEAIHTDKSEDFSRLLKNGSERVAAADMAAAAFVAAFRAGMIRDGMLHALTEQCGSTLFNLQFASAPIREVIVHLGGVRNKAMVVLGCQNLEILRRRTDAAIDFLVKTGMPMRIILSGLKPPRGPIRTPNESRKMDELIDSEIRRRKTEILKNPEIFPLFLEGASSDTNQNLGRVFEHPDALFRGEEKQALIIVSSTFHLLQIAKILARMIEKNDHSIAERISSVILVGAEEPEDVEKFTLHDWQYVKQLAFQLYLENIA